MRLLKFDSPDVDIFISEIDHALVTKVKLTKAHHLSFDTKHTFLKKKSYANKI